MAGDARTFANVFSIRADKRAPMQDIGHKQPVDAAPRIVDDPPINPAGALHIR
ncbi:hypothetical protein [Paraburkholderia sp. 40]|uniref:hypothetical protein n=1 Tax=unclassified Paraburkholderia TaxID=2615204 RepID=UPI003D1BBB93